MNPWEIAATKIELSTELMAVASAAFLKSWGLPAPTVIEPPAGDRRFRAPAWSEQPVFSTYKQAYLLYAQAWLAMAQRSCAPGGRQHEKLEFILKQVLDAVSPTNFALTNPQVLDEVVETGGANLARGFGKLMSDLDSNDGQLRISMIEPGAFEVGRDLAVTPGKVVFQNDLIQLIQYAPSTEQVSSHPVLIVPPWLNKFYVLDLQPENSFIRWMVAQGLTVFTISWVNPDERLAHKSFEDYLLEGPLAALDAIEAATGERNANVIGYCLGGILLAAAAAYLTAKGDDRMKGATYLNTMVDFSDVGDISLFIDADSLDGLEASINAAGYLDGRQIADTFKSIRANDLIWSFFVNNDLMGREPRAWDVLHWNDDSTNMPAAMHTYFMRNMYLHNKLREPGALSLNGVPIDVTKVTTPSYILGTIEDHIAPWKTAYESTQLFTGPRRFVLSESGHIAGVVNPPDQQRYGFWTNTELPADADKWKTGATSNPGSWWPDWLRWVSRKSGAEVPARIPGAGALPVLEDAPGSYVAIRIQSEPASE